MRLSDLKPIRRIEADDLRQLFRLRNDPEIYRWCRQYAPLHWLNHENWYKAQASDRTMSMFVATDMIQDIAGVGGLTSIDYVNRNAEFSVYIAPSHQKRGYGKAFLRKILEHGFYDLGLKRIWGETFEGNHALSMFKSIGMSIEGVKRKSYFRDGKYIDCTLVSILDDEFGKR